MREEGFQFCSLEVSSQKWSHKFGGRIMWDFVHYADQDAVNFAKFGDQQDFWEFRRVRLFMEGFAAFQPAAQMDFVIEASANALPANVPQRAELWNFDTNAFEIVDERTASTTDSVTVIEITSSPESFVRA